MAQRIKYNKKIANDICERIANGEPLRKICRDEYMPCWTTVYNWLNEHQEFSELFARAREIGFDAIAEEALEIANTPIIGEEEEIGEGWTKRKRRDMIEHRKLQVHTRMQLLAKWSPNKYGDKITQEISGPNGSAISITDNERESRLLSIFAAAKVRQDQSNGGE